MDNLPFKVNRWVPGDPKAKAAIDQPHWGFLAACQYEAAAKIIAIGLAHPANGYVLQVIESGRTGGIVNDWYFPPTANEDGPAQ